MGENTNLQRMKVERNRGGREVGKLAVVCSLDYGELQPSSLLPYLLFCVVSVSLSVRCLSNMYDSIRTLLSPRRMLKLSLALSTYSLVHFSLIAFWTNDTLAKLLMHRVTRFNSSSSHCDESLQLAHDKAVDPSRNSQLCSKVQGSDCDPCRTSSLRLRRSESFLKGRDGFLQDVCGSVRRIYKPQVDFLFQTRARANCK
jgi:hypothetical protein